MKVRLCVGHSSLAQLGIWHSNHTSTDTSLHNKRGVSLVSEEEGGHFRVLDLVLVKIQVHITEAPLKWLKYTRVDVVM